MGPAGILATTLLVLVPGPQSVADEEQRGLLEEFRAELARLRRGEDDALTPLQELADRLCADFDRCDAAEVLGFYAQMPPRSRRDGLAAEARYLRLRQRVYEAGELGLAGGEWARERDDVLALLRELVLEVEADSDFVPAAHALALCARLELQYAETSPTLSSAETAALIDQVTLDTRDASALFEAAGQVTPRLELLWVLGRLERLRGQADRARVAFEHCYEEATRVKNDSFREQALQGLVALAVDEGDVLEQERQLRRLASFRAPDESWPVARGWGQLLLSADHPERALEFVFQYAPGEDAYPDDRYDWHLLMGSALMRLGMHAEAREHFQALENGPSKDLAALALARLAVEEDRPDAALERLYADGFPERLDVQDQATWHALAGEALLEAGDPEAALAELRVALELTDDWERTTRGEAETTARSVMGEWQGLHTVTLLAEAHARLGRPIEALAAIEDSQSRTLRRIESERRRVQVEAGARSEAGLVTRGEVLSWARHAELGLVTWVVGANFTVCAWAGPELADAKAPPERARAERIELGRRRLEDAVRRLREAAVGGDDAGVRRIAAELRDALLPQGLLERLRAARDRADPDARLLVLLHGPLERLPLELFELDGTPLDRLLTLVTLPGLPASSPGRPATIAADEWILAGAPVNVEPWPRLPGAHQELVYLSGLYGAETTLAAEAFTLRAMRDALRGPAPLHVATHLVAECEHPDRRLAPVSLLLSGGELLCTHDVAEIGPRSPLVVLSACATAEGRYVDAQGLAGLARAFLESGTRNVAVTLWPVEDRAAQAFSETFHRALSAGNTPARAARRAREALRATGAGPAAVGAFRVLGRD